MTETSIRRDMVEYRGYSLLVSYAEPQWLVTIAAVLMDRPPLAIEKQIVRGWDEEETMRRAKMRIDSLIESPSLH